jgi:hypothetical protein
MVLDVYKGPRPELSLKEIFTPKTLSGCRDILHANSRVQSPLSVHLILSAPLSKFLSKYPRTGERVGNFEVILCRGGHAFDDLKRVEDHQMLLLCARLLEEALRCRMVKSLARLSSERINEFCTRKLG